MPPTIVYLAGYCNRSPEELLHGAVALGATVLDIRFYSKSKRPEWSSQNLRTVLGGYYRPCRAWGDMNFATPGAPVRFANFDAGMAQFEVISGPVIVLCACFDASKCHRSDVARILRMRGYEIKHFQWDQYAITDPVLF